MERLRQYFESAATTAPADRKVGLEVETLFLDANDQPVGEVQARAIFEALVREDWSLAESSASGWDLECGGFALTPEVGAGNIELISSPYPVGGVDKLLDETVDHLEELYRVAGEHGARPVFGSYDGFRDVDNLLLPDDRDHKWASVDGPATLKYLGHIASIHATIDLASIDEAFEMVSAVGDFARQRGLPAEETAGVWAAYLRDSLVDYDTRRYGEAPETFDDYLSLLRSFVVVMDRDDRGGLKRLTPDPPRMADVEDTVDLPTFLGTVWFHTRLRVVDGRLLFEIRVLPRGSDEQLVEGVQALLETVGGLPSVDPSSS